MKVSLFVVTFAARDALFITIFMKFNGREAAEGFPQASSPDKSASGAPDCPAPGRRTEGNARMYVFFTGTVLRTVAPFQGDGQLRPARLEARRPPSDASRLHRNPLGGSFRSPWERRNCHGLPALVPAKAGVPRKRRGTAGEPFAPQSRRNG